MRRFKFWASIIFPIILGLIGVYIASLVPVPNERDQILLEIFYGMLGILLGIATFSQLAAWVVRTFTRLLREFTARVALEIINQVGQLRRDKSPISLRGLIHPSVDLEQMDESLQKLEQLSQRSIKDKNIMVLDTSSIIDGRIVDVAKTGFLHGVVVLPNFVLKELQLVSDSADRMKRTRGRRGFESMEKLKRMGGVKVMLWEQEVEGKEVDDKIISLAKYLKAKILTCDYNLNRRAKVSGLDVLNLNELANALKTVVLPGERFEIKLLQKGKDKEQGVGYLEDGTMVIVEQASNMLNKQVLVEATKMIQNPAGRIVFGKTVE